MNGKESDARWGTGTHSPQEFEGMLKRYGNVDYYLGTTPSVSEDDISRWFKGDIADVKMWNRALTSQEVKDLGTNPTDDGLVLHYDFKGGSVQDRSEEGNDGVSYNCELNNEEIKIQHTIVPHRVPGRMTCLPHKDEGLVKIDGVDKWAKGETTARNEKRFVYEMQQGKWDYKSDGINSLKYELVSIEEITPNAKFINIKL